MIKCILPTIALGVLVGYINNMFGAPIINRIFSEYLFNFSLVSLLFLMGMLFALDEKVTTKMKAAGLKCFVFPFAVALGSLIGGFVEA